MQSLTETQQQIADAMSEAELQDSVIALAKQLGWKVHAERPAMTNKGYRTPIQGDKGYPDITLARDTPNWTVMWVECKSETGKLSKEQKLWHEVLRDVWIWRPSDWISGEVQKILE